MQLADPVADNIIESLRVTREWKEWDRELSKRMTAMLVSFAILNQAHMSAATGERPSFNCKEASVTSPHRVVRVEC